MWVGLKETGFPQFLTETKFSKVLKFLNKQYQFTELKKLSKSAMAIIEVFLATTLSAFFGLPTIDRPPQKHDSSGVNGGAQSI